MANEIFGFDYGGASCAIVHQDRLVLAGGGAVPDVVAASKTGEWQDFAVTVGEGVPAANAGFWFQQVSARGNRFHALLQQQGLLLLGDVGESSVPPGPFTAAETSIRENSWLGSDTGRTPVIAGNLVVFLQKDGEDIRGLAWNEQQLKYLAPSLLTLAGNVFERARDMTYQGSAGRRGDTVYVIDEDGTLAVLLLRVGDDVPAWSRWQTSGRVIGASAPLGEVVFIVERNGVAALETLAPTGERLDCEVELAPGATLPDWMEGLDGEVLAIRVLGDDTETDGPEAFTITNGRPVATGLDQQATMKVGLRYERVLETVQFVKRTQTGTSGRVRPARIIDAAVDFVITAEEEAAIDARGRAPPEVWQRLKTATFTIVPYSRRGKKRSRPGKEPRMASGRIYSVRYPCRLGWRDRIAVELRSDRHVEIAGVAYRAAA